MTSRDAILAAIRANKPAPHPLPDVPLFDEGRDHDLLGRFAEALRAMGGTMLEASADDPLAAIRARIAEAQVVCSMVPKIAGNRVIAPALSSRGGEAEPGIHHHDLSDEGATSRVSTDNVVTDSGLARRSPRNDGATTEPASLADVDIAIVRAAFGITETGSVAFTERELGVNTLAYLAQHLVVLLDPADIVVNLHHAYQRPEFATARYTVFHTGPSATADIEGVLIRGAQGVRSLAVLPLPRSC